MYIVLSVQKATAFVRALFRHGFLNIFTRGIQTLSNWFQMRSLLALLIYHSAADVARIDCFDM